MRSCFQFRDQSVYDHGLSVRRWYIELRDHLLDGDALTSVWRLPDWIGHPLLREILGGLDETIMDSYQVFHDCGKPTCRIVDADGHQHFPDHANVSRERWLECSNGSASAHEVADLIGMDMDAHLLKPDDVDGFASRPQAIPLLLTALCEVHSNATMFGGIESDGFKIKWKKLNKLGGRIINAIVAQRQSRDL